MAQTKRWDDRRVAANLWHGGNWAKMMTLDKPLIQLADYHDGCELDPI
jgi:hypothetical protein